MIAIDELQSVLGQVEIAPELRAEIIQKAEEIEQDKKSSRGTKTKQKSKNSWVVVLKSPGQIDPNTVAHIFQMDCEDDLGTVVTKVKDAGVNQNINAKRKKSKVESFDDVIHIKRRWLKEKGVALKSKEDWVRIVQLPEDFKFGVGENNE